MTPISSRPSLRLHLLALATLTLCQDGFAQAAADATATVLDTVVVTSRKRPEASQTVPLAISAFSADTLDRAKISNAQDLQFSIPNAVLVGNDKFSIRGIGSNTLGGQGGIGFAINGSTIDVLPQDELFDVERIEVLRGPQGTLFGRNTTGGAMSVFTKRPTDKQEGYVKGELGNFGTARAEAMINIPIGENLRQRFSGYFTQRDGFTRNLATGNNIDGRHQYSLRSSTRLFIGDDTEVNLMLSAYQEDSSRTRETKRLCKADAVLGCSPNQLGFDSPNGKATVFGALGGLPAALGLLKAGTDIYAGAANPTNLREVAADYDPRFMLHSRAGTLEVSHDFKAATLTYVAGYSEVKSDQRTDWDNAALAVRFAAPITYRLSADEQVTTDQIRASDAVTSHNHTWTQELRLASKGQGAFSYTTGLYQLSTKSGGGFFAYHPFIELFEKFVLKTPAEAWFISNESNANRTKAWAWFGEGQLRLGEAVRATLGARYTSEEQTGQSRSIVLTGPAAFKDRTPIKASKWTGRAAVDYAPQDGLLFFGSISPGYKGGGFNPGNLASPSYKPETVTAYEVGVKRDWSRTLRTNASVFYNDYQNMQIAQRAGGTVITSNVDAKIQGAEFEMQWAPASDWLVDASFSLLRTRIGHFMTVDSANPAQSAAASKPEVAIDLAGNQLPGAPRSKIKLGGQYTLPVADGWRLTGRMDYVWQASYFAREYNTVNDRIGAWGVTNLQLRLANADGKLEYRMVVKNLSNKNNITSLTVEDALLGSYRNARLLDPRTVSFEVAARF